MYRHQYHDHKDDTKLLPGAAPPAVDVAVPPKSVPAAFVVLFVVPKGVEEAALPVFVPNKVPADVLLVALAVPAPKRVPAEVFVVAGVVPNPVAVTDRCAQLDRPSI